MRVAAVTFGLVLAFGGTMALAQSLYRWTDDQGRTHLTDTPPPASARNIQKKAAAAAKTSTPPAPFALTQAQRNFPVVLYTSPGCKEGCSLARSLLNKRGIPFKEVQVWDEDTNAELKRVSGGSEVPVLVVGRSTQRGFEAGAYEGLLDTAGYPKTGLPAGTQVAPPAPEGYQTPAKPETAKPIEAPEPATPRGPYSPR